MQLGRHPELLSRSQASRSLAKFFTFVGVNGCSEHTGVVVELEKVSKHVRGDPQLGCVERVDDDALDAQAPRVPEQRRKFLPVVQKFRPPALVRQKSGPPRCIAVAASIGKLVTLGAIGATEPAHAPTLFPFGREKALAWNSQSPRMCVGIALYFAAKYIGSSHIRSLPSQFTTGSTPVCSTLKDQAITRNELSNVPGHTSDFLQTVIKHRWFFVIPEPISELKLMTMRLSLWENCPASPCKLQGMNHPLSSVNSSRWSRKTSNSCSSSQYRSAAPKSLLVEDSHKRGLSRNNDRNQS